MVDLLNKKTKNACKILTVELDLRKEEACKELVKKHLDFHHKVDSMYVYHPLPALVIVNDSPGYSVLNHGTQNANEYLPTLPTEQWLQTFDTNIHSFFYILSIY